NNNNGTETTTPVKKRQYKRRDKQPKENVERKPKKSTARKSVKKQKTLDTNDFVPSPVQNSSFGSNLFPAKNSTDMADNSFNENEAAETLVSIFDSKEVKKENNDSLSYNSGNELDLDDSNSKLTATSNKSSRLNTTIKRNKSANQKFKSAEVINSSDDSSSDDNVDVDKNPVSLLVNQSDFNENFDTENSISNRKRHNSNSSLSSVSSNSSKSSRSMIETGMEIDGGKHENKAFNEEHHIKSKKTGEEKSNKHKKNKKHSKNKHRHGEEKQHKKHKKNKEKDRNKDVAKIKEKDFKPKLNIKFGQGPSDTLNQSTSNKVAMKEFDEDFKESGLIINKNEKKSTTKSKKLETEDVHNELVFIKDTAIKTKEAKSKKNPIISVDTSLFGNNDSIVNASSMNKGSKTKDITFRKENKKAKNKDFDLIKEYDESLLPSSSLKLKKEKSIKDSKKEKDSQHIIGKKDENQACTVISETINVTSETIDNKLWICPIC
ncbi:hypothetical protein BLA29_005293, partial [Euroglyphus maynei]